MQQIKRQKNIFLSNICLVENQLVIIYFKNILSFLLKKFAELKGKYLLCINKSERQMKNQKQQVKVLGQTVTVGTKLHAKLIAQVKQFNDLAKYETN